MAAPHPTKERHVLNSKDSKSGGTINDRWKFIRSLGLLHPGSLEEGDAAILCLDVDLLHGNYLGITALNAEKQQVKIRLPHNLVAGILDLASHKNQPGFPLNQAEQL